MSLDITADSATATVIDSAIINPSPFCTAAEITIPKMAHLGGTVPWPT